MIHTSRMVVLSIALTALAGCADRAQTCRGMATADSVEGAGPAIAAFKDHLKEYSSGSELDVFFGDFHHYDLAITTSESTFEYEFIPRSDRKGYKGGGARYVVSRDTRQIVRTEYMK